MLLIDVAVLIKDLMAEIEEHEDDDSPAGIYAAHQMRLFIDKLRKAPTIDAVPITHCKDCIHRDPEDKRCDCGAMERQGATLPVANDYFCKYGKRRTDE